MYRSNGGEAQGGGTFQEKNDQSIALGRHMANSEGNEHISAAGGELTEARRT